MLLLRSKTSTNIVRQNSMQSPELLQKWKLRVFLVALVSLFGSLFILAFASAGYVTFYEQLTQETVVHYTAGVNYDIRCKPSSAARVEACKWMKPEHCCTDGCIKEYYFSKHKGPWFLTDDAINLVRLHRSRCIEMQNNYSHCVEEADIDHTWCVGTKDYLTISAREHVVQRWCFPMEWQNWALCGAEAPDGIHHYAALLFFVACALCAGGSLFFVLYPSGAPLVAVLFCRCCIRMHNGSSPNGRVYQVHPRCCLFRWMFRGLVSDVIESTNGIHDPNKTASTIKKD
jgi:hypothetical protein